MAGLVQRGMVLCHLCVTVVLVEINTVNTFVVARWGCAGFNRVASHAKGAGFFTSAVNGSMVVLTAFVAPAHHYIISHITYAIQSSVSC